MPYASLMVDASIDGAQDARLRVAGDLAARFDAKLIGIAALDPASSIGPLDEQLAAAECAFRAVADRCAPEVEWRGAIANPVEHAVAESRAADLIIAGTGVGGANLSRSVSVADLVLRAGRPVLALPPSRDWLRTENMLVAWKDCREARRAVSDALPLLRRAKEVTVVAVAEGGDDPTAAISRRVNDVVAWLGRHDVVAFGMQAAAADAADQIETTAREIGADIVVAGAFGHARLREQIFGGVTQAMLTRSEHCSLLSH